MKRKPEVTPLEPSRGEPWLESSQRWSSCSWRPTACTSLGPGDNRGAFLGLPAPAEATWDGSLFLEAQENRDRGFQISTPRPLFLCDCETHTLPTLSLLWGSGYAPFPPKD